MNRRPTSVSERERFVELHREGATLRQVAVQMGRSFECVRLWWRRYHRGGWRALAPADRRKARGGAMSRFPQGVRTACYELKQQHPGWGAPVVRLRMAEQLAVPLDTLPCTSTIEKYWVQQQPPLTRRHRPLAPPVVRRLPPPVSQPHERWQLDFKEGMMISTLGRIDVLNIRDEATPIMIESRVYPARQTSGRDIQETLRRAFTKWGLPDRVQSDRDKRLYNANHPNPFPTRVLLWLAGLGIAHDLAPHPTVNGCVERANAIWFERVVSGRHFTTREQLQETSDEELDLINWRLPSRGRACEGRPPLVAYPMAMSPRREYRHDKELELFDITRVYQYLAGQKWWRHVSPEGQVSIGGHRHSIGVRYAHQEVQLAFDAAAVEFVVHSTHGELLTRFAPRDLTASEITGLDPSVPNLPPAGVYD